MTGEAVGTARATLGSSFSGQWQVEVESRGEGSRLWATLARRRPGERAQPRRPTAAPEAEGEEAPAMKPAGGR